MPGLDQTRQHGGVVPSYAAVAAASNAMATTAPKGGCVGATTMVAGTDAPESGADGVS